MSYKLIYKQLKSPKFSSQYYDRSIFLEDPKLTFLWLKIGLLRSVKLYLVKKKDLNFTTQLFFEPYFKLSDPKIKSSGEMNH